MPDFGFPEPVMSFAITPKSKGDEEKVATGDPAARGGGSRRCACGATSRRGRRSSPG